MSGRSSIVLLCALLMASCNCSRGSKPVRPGSVAKNQAFVRVGSAQNKRSPIGTNLSGITDWSTEIPFIDLFKSSRPWISGSAEQFDDGRPVATDASGWVRELQLGQVARTLILWDVVHYPAGEYLVLYDGEGEIEYQSPGVAVLDETKSKPGRHVLSVDPVRGAQAIQLVVTKTAPQNPIRNIRVLLPGGACEGDPFKWCDSDASCGSATCTPFEQNHEQLVFNPRFLDGLRTYSVIRFMDWGGTNDSEIAKWTERPTLSDARWSDNGAPLEVMVDLAHRLQAEPWFNVPHRANDDYVSNMAALVHKRLKPEYRAWIEFSNEVWNGHFLQHREVRSCAQASKADGPFHAALLCYSERAVQVLSIWEHAFAAQPGRLVRVLAAQAANVWTSEQILDHKDAYQHADALAVAPYFGATPNPDEAAGLVKLSPAKLLRKTRDEDLPAVLKSLKQTAKLARKKGLQLVAYEGGQHLVGIQGAENNDQLSALFDAANRDPEMGRLYSDYLAGWKDNGGTLFVNYTSCDPYTKWGRFGVIEYLGQPRSQAPKFDAVQRFIENNPRWW